MSIEQKKKLNKAKRKYSLPIRGMKTPTLHNHAIASALTEQSTIYSLCNRELYFIFGNILHIVGIKDHVYKLKQAYVNVSVNDSYFIIM